MRAALAAAMGLAVVGCAASPPPAALADTSVTLTFYGWPDNDPPRSARIRWPVIHSQAGGSGSYNDPTTVAVRVGGRWGAGTKMYLPYLQKYLIVEDSCAGCGTNHIDVWAGGAGRNSADVTACERSLTPHGQVAVEIDPPPGRPVNAGQLC
jgi:hypothetical protein